MIHIRRFFNDKDSFIVDIGCSIAKELELISEKITSKLSSNNKVKVKATRLEEVFGHGINFTINYKTKLTTLRSHAIVLDMMLANIAKTEGYQMITDQEIETSLNRRYRTMTFEKAS